jgi:hypothetical protein
VNLQRSRILDILGPDLFAPFPAVRIPGTVIWCNFELARELGFDVPESNRMSPELHEQLTSMFSFRALRPKEEQGSRPVITLYADKYGGDGIAPNQGSARGGFHPYCNAFIKGIGHTPLFWKYDSRDFEHSHGGLNMDQAFSEAVFGEVNLNLFDRKSPRILVIIDQGDSTVYPKNDRHNPGKVFPRAISVRVGNQLRPAHLLAKGCWKRRSRLDVFASMARASQQLVTAEEGAESHTVDLRSTMLRIIDGHALTAAQQVRWRLSHLNLSCSNMKMDGGMLDLTTQRTHPRLPPIHPDHSLLDSETAPYPDYADRTGRIIDLYRALRRSISQSESQVANAGPLSIRKEMDRCYRRHLQRQLLCVTGLRTKVADSVLQNYPDAVERFTDVLIELARIKNPSRGIQSRMKIFGVAAFDIFHLLATYPARYFAKPQAGHAGFVHKALRPIYKGSAAQLARKRGAARRLVPQFCAAYHELMQAVESRAAEYYGTVDAMRVSIQSRAAFENRITPLLFRKTYCDDFDDAIAAYRSSGKLDSVRKVIDDRISASLRNIDQLLRHGQSRILEDGALELQIHVVDGVRYSVRAWNNSENRRSLHVSAPLELIRESLHRASGAGTAQSCACGLRYRFTTDGWASSSETAVHLEIEPQTGSEVVHAVIPVACVYGELQGIFCGSGGGGNKCGDHRSPEGRYVFAVPDQIELSEMLKEFAGTAALSASSFSDN